ncbi:MAG: hypothetical protein AAB229_01970 [Candidatus Hydrogenedentota bacterium]
MSPELRAMREGRLRDEILRFISHMRATDAPASEIEAILRDNFGKPEFVRESFLRSDTDTPVWNHRAGITAGGGVILASCFAAAVLKACEFGIALRLPAMAPYVSSGVSAVILTLSTLTGIIGYVVHWILRGNRYRVAPFVMLSTLAFFLAGSIRMDVEILERQPVFRYHVLLTAAIPVVDMSGRTSIRHYIADWDRTGLPQKYTRARAFTEARDELPTAKFRLFWLLVAAIAIGNFYVLKKMADELALVEDEP